MYLPNRSLRPWTVTKFVASNKSINVPCDASEHVAVETNVDASDDEIQIVVVDPPYHGIIRRRSIDRHRFTMADVKDGSVTYEHTGNSSTDDFRFVVSVSAVESTGNVAVHVTNVTSPTTEQNQLRVVTNIVAVVDELKSVRLSPQVLKVAHGDNIYCSVDYKLFV